MFWNNNADMKEWMETISSRITDLQLKMDTIIQDQEDKGSVKQIIEDIFYCPDEHNPISRIHDMLCCLFNDTERHKEVILAEKTLDKFDDYMKIVDKLNSMINEFKGCVSLARASLKERGQLDEEKTLIKESFEIHQSIISLIESFRISQYDYEFKLDMVYKNVCSMYQVVREYEEKKSPKRRKSVKKKVPQDSQS